MSNVVEYLIAGVLVAAVLIITYGLSNRWSRSRVEKDFRKPDEILTAVDVYLKYDRRKAAEDLLAHGLRRYPQDPALRKRAADMGLEHPTEED